MTYKFDTQKKTEYEFPKTRKSFFVFENAYFASSIRNGEIKS